MHQAIADAISMRWNGRVWDYSLGSSRHDEGWDTGGYMEEDSVASLFRKEATTLRDDGSLGHVALAPPKIASLTLIASVTVIALIALIASVGTYTPTLPGVGETKADPPTMTVRPPKSGVVKHVLVAKGDVVAAGEPLFTVSTALSTKLSENTASAISSALNSKLMNLKDQLRNLSNSTNTRRASLKNVLEIALSQYKDVERQIEIQSQRTQRTAQLYERWKAAGINGVVSKLQILQQQDQMLASQADLERLKNEALERKQQIENAKDRLEELSLKNNQDESSLRLEISDLEKQLAVNAQDSEIIVRSPAAGKISNILAWPGQVMTTSDHAMTVTPEHGRLRVFLKADQDIMPYIKKGQSVAVSYPALPFTRTAPQRGVVSDLSTVPYQDDKEGATTPKSVYQIIVDIPAPEVSYKHRSYKIIPGLVVDARFLLSEKSLMDIGRQ